MNRPESTLWVLLCMAACHSNAGSDTDMLRTAPSTLERTEPSPPTSDDSFDAQANPDARPIDPGYEVWGSDQSNTVPGQASLGINGGLIWVWPSEAIEAQVAGHGLAQSLPCAGMNSSTGPCDVNEVFPAGLLEYDADGTPTGQSRPQIGRLHGMLVDPQNKYFTANLFSPGGGFVGIIDGRTKAAVALFRATATSVGRSNHMSFWNADGSAIIVANLDGKLLERVDLTRDAEGNITAATFVEGAGLGTGKGLSVVDRPHVYLGNNLAGEPMIGTIAPGTPDLGDLTPTGHCRENGCAAGIDGSAGGRPNNLIICPIPSTTTDHVFVTLAAGGLLVVDASTTPMRVVGEYGNQIINGAGCGGVQADSRIFLDAGVSASAAGANQSTFTIYELEQAFPDAPGFNAENMPLPAEVFADPENTATNGRTTGPATNPTGQLPSMTTRRDAHGMAVSQNHHYVHTADRIQNEVEVLALPGRTRHHDWYDLTSADGKGKDVGPCELFSVVDDPALPSNDPAPDLMEMSPNGEYLFIAFRGPVPVSAPHASQGSCPGVGVVRMFGNGQRGQLTTVLRTTNTIDTASAAPQGGHPYAGAERSDVHAACLRVRGPGE